MVAAPWLKLAVVARRVTTKTVPLQCSQGKSHERVADTAATFPFNQAATATLPGTAAGTAATQRQAYSDVGVSGDTKEVTAPAPQQAGRGSRCWVQRCGRVRASEAAKDGFVVPGGWTASIEKGGCKPGRCLEDRGEG